MALALADFFDQLTISSLEYFEPDQSSLMSRGMNGKLLETLTGFAKWRARMILVPKYHRDYRKNAAVLNKARPGISFYAYDKRARWPAADPNGTILGASTPQINSINVDNRRISLKGLPATYVITAGDQLSIALPDSTVSLHRVVGGATASGGVTPQFEIYPHLPWNIAVNQYVTLVKPYAEFVISPGTHIPGIAGGVITVGDTLEIEEK